MDGTLAAEPTAEEATQINEAIQAYLLEIKKLRERMRLDQLEIEQSRARTQEMLIRMQAQLARLEAQ
ncbi:MAG: hypothetical protein M3Y56_01815 [Armatimonadota bacterium]|nr:hypothetical protein [Armatimonadota bacterium]